MNPYIPPHRRVRYGLILVKADAGRVLLRENFPPADEFRQFVHGEPCGGESPVATARRAFRECCGAEPEISRPIPRWFASCREASYFFVATVPRGQPFVPWPTPRDVRWFSWEEAAALLEANGAAVELLRAARAVAHTNECVPVPSNWEPGPVQWRPAKGYPGYFQQDLENFWLALQSAALNGRPPADFFAHLDGSKDLTWDPLRLQAFFLSTAALLRQQPGLLSSECETASGVERPMEALCRGVRRGFMTIYSRSITGNPDESWEPAQWCRMAAGWFPDCVQRLDQLGAWCESAAAELHGRIQSASIG